MGFARRSQSAGGFGNPQRAALSRSLAHREQLGDPPATAWRVLSARACSPSCAPVDPIRKVPRAAISECACSTGGTRPSRTTGPLPRRHPATPAPARHPGTSATSERITERCEGVFCAAPATERRSGAGCSSRKKPRGRPFRGTSSSMASVATVPEQAGGGYVCASDAGRHGLFLHEFLRATTGLAHLARVDVRSDL